MTSTEAEVPRPETVGDPAVPVVDIPPDENVNAESLVEARSADVAKTDTDMQDAAVVETVTTEATVKTEVTEVVTTVVTITEKVKAENPVDDTTLGKREREEDTENGAQDSKRVKTEENGKEEKAPVTPVKLGPKLFQSGIEMFTYFYDLLHGWATNVDFNKYEHMVLMDLLTKGHRDAESKVGSGIQAFQIRFHSGWHSRCYYLIRTDGSDEDFSYRKCVDRLMPLPESLFTPSGDLIVEKLFGEGGKWDKKGKGRGGGGHREKGGKSHQGNGNKGKGGGGGWRGGKGGGGRGNKW